MRKNAKKEIIIGVIMKLPLKVLVTENKIIKYTSEYIITEEDLADIPKLKKMCKANNFKDVEEYLDVLELAKQDSVDAGVIDSPSIYIEDSNKKKIYSNELVDSDDSIEESERN